MLQLFSHTFVYSLSCCYSWRSYNRFGLLIKMMALVYRNYIDVFLACDPPFDAEPDCFSSLGHYMITSPACASAYARMFNVSNAAPLASVAANVNAIQDACTQVTTEVVSRRSQCNTWVPRPWCRLYSVQETCVLLDCLMGRTFYDKPVWLVAHGGCVCGCPRQQGHRVREPWWPPPVEHPRFSQSMR